MSIILVDEQFLPQAAAIVETAKKTIDISTFKAEEETKGFRAPLHDFFKHLCEKSKEGVRVRLLLNFNEQRASVPRTNIIVARLLKAAGIKTRYLKNNRCNHAKLICVDKQKLIIGSHNLSSKSCKSNFEISILTTDEEIIKNVTRVYDSSFDDGKDF